MVSSAKAGIKRFMIFLLDGGKPSTPVPMSRARGVDLLFLRAQFLIPRRSSAHRLIMVNLDCGEP
jgi:hypothetical protein